MKALVVKLLESFLIAFRALRENRMRSVLTTSGIIIGVLTVVSVASIIAGLNQGFADQISSLGSNTLFVGKFPWAKEGSWFDYINRPDIDMEQVDFLKENLKTPAIISPSTETRRNIKYKDNEVESIDVKSATVETPQVEDINLASGRFFSSTEIRRRKNSVVLGWEIKEKLFPDQLAEGKRIRIGAHTFNVIGVAEKKGKFMGQSMDAFVYIPLGTLFKKFGSHRSLEIAIKVKNPQKIKQAKEEIQFRMRVARGLKPLEKNNFAINQQSMIFDIYNSITKNLYTAALGIGALSLLVGGIGIMNIMLVSVSERKKEIGIRKAIGATRGLISLQFIIESIVICSIGGVIAISLSFLMAFLINKFTPFPGTVPMWSIFMGMGFSTFVGLFFGIYPARQAAKLNPIDCLHYE